jgi:hypothetical protein
MKTTMLHIFRNSPLGRENLMQSAYFCKQQPGMSLAVYLPQTAQFTMEPGGDLVVVELDESYVRYPSTAQHHVKQILTEFDCRYEFHTPSKHDKGRMPHLPGNWAMMACPRVLTEQSSRIGLGHLGPKVRSLAKLSRFPIFIPSMSFKAWTNVTAFFGGSELGAIVVKAAMAIARLARVPLTVHTQLNGTTREECEKSLSAVSILDSLSGGDIQWRVCEDGTLEENLYAVPHDSLVLVGAAGHKLIRELVFGSKLEAIQATLPNPLVIIGPECRTPWDLLPESGV